MYPTVQRSKRVKRLLSSGLALLAISSTIGAYFSPRNVIASDSLVIKGDGSTFAYPMYSKWIEEYQKQDPGVQFTYESNGSGAGIHDIIKGTVDFAGTDGPLNSTQLLDFSTHRNCEALHFPMALGADVPIYNIPGVIQELRFTPDILAGIYLGKITTWNDAAIAKANPDVSLPSKTIVVVHRQDGSGTTYVWTDYLSKVNAEWREAVGSGISVNWPVGHASMGNSGVVQFVADTPYTIGYSELTYAIRKHLFYGSVQNSSGNFVKADLTSVTEAAQGASANMPEDFRISIVNAPGSTAYPISSFTWMLVPSVIVDPAQRAAIVGFIKWGLTSGQEYLPALSYARLPAPVVDMAEKAIERIKSSGSSRSAKRRATNNLTQTSRRKNGAAFGAQSRVNG